MQGLTVQRMRQARPRGGVRPVRAGAGAPKQVRREGCAGHRRDALPGGRSGVAHPRRVRPLVAAQQTFIREVF
ncbi:hypothetical protein ATO9_11850 [Pseudooceanicola atlanticus]|uniref:Uncharacterized protein n=1 Tax=Pseudooceanicola atlanticus TaxID=1461694 RepID=A0A0A0ED59_9RHOB|nr:hypothetical protein ATO9_11850 [Pseudooceanicola atlanticus]